MSFSLSFSDPIDKLKFIGHLIGQLGSSRTADESVADANHSFNTIAAFAQLLSQAPDMDVERARVAVVAVTPHVVEKLLASNNAVSALR